MQRNLREKYFCLGSNLLCQGMRPAAQSMMIVGLLNYFPVRMLRVDLVGCFLIFISFNDVIMESNLLCQGTWPTGGGCPVHDDVNRLQHSRGKIFIF